MVEVEGRALSRPADDGRHGGRPSNQERFRSFGYSALVHLDGFRFDPFCLGMPIAP